MLPHSALQQRPLEGLRVIDYSHFLAGPYVGRCLAALGAEVIKVESAMRPDAFRKPHPVYGREGPATFDQVASTKLSVRINLKKPEGIALARRLVAVSDIAAESFRAGVLDRLGLGGSFEAVHDLHAMDLVPKPNASAPPACAAWSGGRPDRSGSRAGRPPALPRRRHRPGPASA